MSSEVWHWPDFIGPRHYDHDYYNSEDGLLYPGINYLPIVSVPGPEEEEQPETSQQVMLRVKMNEVEAKIKAWEDSKVAKINNRFKREESIINGRVEEKANKAKAKLQKVQRKLDEKKLKAEEKMENVVAKAKRKADQKKASAEGKKGTKVEQVVHSANMMRAVGRPPVKQPFIFRIIDYLF